MLQQSRSVTSGGALQGWGKDGQLRWWVGPRWEERTGGQVPTHMELTF